MKEILVVGGSVVVVLGMTFLPVIFKRRHLYLLGLLAGLAISAALLHVVL